MGDVPPRTIARPPTRTAAASASGYGQPARDRCAAARGVDPKDTRDRSAAASCRRRGRACRRARRAGRVRPVPGRVAEARPSAGAGRPRRRRRSHPPASRRRRRRSSRRARPRRRSAGRRAAARRARAGVPAGSAAPRSRTASRCTRRRGRCVRRSATAPRSESGSPSVPARRARPSAGRCGRRRLVETASPPPKRKAVPPDGGQAASCVGAGSVPSDRSRPGGPSRTWPDDVPATRPPAARMRPSGKRGRGEARGGGRQRPDPAATRSARAAAVSRRGRREQVEPVRLREVTRRRRGDAEVAVLPDDALRLRVDDDDPVVPVVGDRDHPVRPAHGERGPVERARARAGRTSRRLGRPA